MPKKKSAKPAESKQQNDEEKIDESGDYPRVAFQVRFDHELHRKLKMYASAAGISLNQLVQGLCQGCVSRIQLGEVVRETPDDEWNMRLSKKCLTIVDFPEDHPYGDKSGHVWFKLDFTDRSAVQHPG